MCCASHVRPIVKAGFSSTMEPGTDFVLLLKKKVRALLAEQSQPLVATAPVIDELSSQHSNPIMEHCAISLL
jgi:hypothetical protein